MKEIKDLKIKDSEKLNAMTESALKKEVVTSQKAYFSLKMKKHAGELKQTHLVKAMRRYIAKLKTLANAKWFNI